MAILKDSVVTGNLRVTGDTMANGVQAKIIRAPTSSGATTFGPGTDGQILKSNGTTVYWASDNNTDTLVTQTATTTSAAYEILFSGTADNTTRTEGARKTNTLTYNPSTKALSTGGTVNGLTLTAASTGFTISGGTTSKTLTVGETYTLGAACAKGVTDNSSSTAVTSTDTNLITARTLYYAGYTKTTGTVTSVGTGVGLTGGAITTSGTIKAKLRSETALTNDSAAATETSGRIYPVAQDKSGYLAVNVPWTDNNNYVSQSASTTANWRKVLLHYKDDAATTTAVTSSQNVVYAAVGVSVQPSTGTLRTVAYNINDKCTLQWNSTDNCVDFVFS